MPYQDPFLFSPLKTKTKKDFEVADRPLKDEKSDVHMLAFDDVYIVNVFDAATSLTQPHQPYGLPPRLGSVHIEASRPPSPLPEIFPSGFCPLHSD